ncbi:hypothetical protein DM867_12885 [Halosegnis rubeus]|uniref:Uncharacterized protein n=1 Tax=Halosegnis rubeus TaxID=2212850 RepID=A0A5N5U1S2_9EURY|nr:hypothetical protein [Halosegnis rubeus]KAB7512480.1 hypothetical protein DM867_12885 [Halosegnis rubeus]
MGTREATGGGVQTGSLTSIHWAGIALAVATGLLHLYLVALYGLSTYGISFAVAGVGFLGGAAVLALDVDVPRRPLYALGALWTLGQIVAWYVIKVGSFSTLGYVDKAIQVALIAVLAVLIQREG